MESIWLQTAQGRERQPLTKDLQTDVAIIGGGMAGILTAYLLRQRGVEAVVLEGERVGSGQTKNTTAKVTSQHGLIYAKLIDRFGREKAGQYAAANQSAIAQYRKIIEEMDIGCDFEQLPAYIYSTKDGEVLKREGDAAQKLGLPAEFVTQTELPFEVAGAVRFDNQAQFNPLKFLYALADHVPVYERSFVTQVDKDTLYVNGCAVMAQRVVFATHFPFINVPGYYFARMHQERSYVVALENAAKLDGMYIGVDDEVFSFRNYGDLLLLGGGKHRTGENSAGGRYDLLLDEAKRLYPGATEATRWSAQDCMTLDSVPYIGQYAPDTHWYVATGFMKWGMTTSMAAATILADVLTGLQNPNAEVFSPQRFNLASLPNLFKDGGKSVKGLARENLSLPKAVLDELLPGRGGVVKVKGDKIGVFKDVSGEVFMVNTRCPHLGCQLEWNADEKSWDCPCHGSRFDYRGKLIGGPAQKGASID